MAWIRVETSVARHRKFMQAGPTASWLWLCGLGYCQEGLTDGFIPVEALEFLGVKSAAEAAASLVKAGLWRSVEGGWMVHDYLDHNKPAAEIRRIQKERRIAGIQGGRASGRSRRKAPGREAADQVAEAEMKQPSKPSTDLLSTSTPSAAIDEPRVEPSNESTNALLTFPTVGLAGKSWPLMPAQVTRWCEAFPDLDVLSECRRALAWIEANPAKRKTAGGMTAFLVRWLNQTVDQGRSRGNTASAGVRTSGNVAALQTFLKRRNT